MDDAGAAARAAGLTIGERRRVELAPAPDPAAVRAAVDDDGYFQLAPCLPAELVAQARRSVELVTDRGAPAVAGFVFDPMWQLLDAVTPLVRAVLGHPIAVLPAFWAWRVRGGGAGWPPHRDRTTTAFTDDGRLASLTVWIPLTAATVRNGCIHVVPRWWDHQYANPEATGWMASQQHLLALPAAPGAVLGWTHRLLHWGGASPAGEPDRISTSFELIRADAPAADPPYPEGYFPDLDERVTVIEAQLQQYRHMHELSADQLAPIARLLASVRRAYR